jgi:hypothetical protein
VRRSHRSSFKLIRFTKRLRIGGPEKPGGHEAIYKPGWRADDDRERIHELHTGL